MLAILAKRILHGSSSHMPLARIAKKIVRCAVTIYDYSLALACRPLLMRSGGNRRGDDVVLVRVDNIGDFVLWLPYAQRLREHFAGRKIILAVNAAVAGLATSFDLWDEVVAVSRDRFRDDLRYRLGILKRLNGASSTLINAVPNADFGVAGAMSISLGLRESYGSFYAGPSLKTFLAAPHYRHRLTLQISEPEQEKNGKFVDFVLGTSGRAPDGTPPHPLASRKLRGPSTEPRSPYFVVLPGATWEGRKWATERFATVARRLQAKTGWSGYVLGTKSDQADGESIAAAIGANGYNLCGQTDLAGLVSVIQGASLVLTNESGGAHIANAVGAPLVCVLGGGHFGRFLPSPSQRPSEFMVTEPMACYGCDWNCRFHRQPGRPVRCIEQQGAEDVWNLVLRALDSRNHELISGDAYVAS